MLFSINWAVNSEIIDGYRTPNLYGLLFVTGLILGYFVVKKMFQKEQISNDILDKLVMYMVLATIIGARLGHVLFYGPYYDTISNGVILERGYFSHPGDIIKIWEGGLASHGAALAILISLYIFSKKVVKKSFLWTLDRMAAPIAIGAAFIRFGNLVNHEMVGHVTSVPWGFKFLHHDCGYPYQCDWSMIPVRHPTQLYEALCYLFVFGLLLFFYWRKELWRKKGFIFGVFLVLVFGTRFFIEFLKEGQTARDFEYFINTGQILSIPFVIAGIFLVYRALKTNKPQNS